jgi:DNA gyrase/topoisomerase IV subunit A
MTDNKLNEDDASEIATHDYTEYSKYVNAQRAEASIFDGLKVVQRRIIYEANKLPAKLTKSVNLVGNAIKLHPHGDASIYGAMVGMASPTNNLPLFFTKGNWGGFGYGAAASRYTELYLSDVARFIYCQFIDYAPYEEGEIGLLEPKYLPCLMPYALVEGSSGIGVGLSADVVPLNMIDVVDYYIDYIVNGKFDHSKTPKPDFGSCVIKMSTEDCHNAVQGYSGQFSISSIISQESDTVFVIESLYGKSIDRVLQKLSNYIDTDKVDYRNESTTSERYVFEIVDRSVDTNDFKKRLADSTSKKASFNRVFSSGDKSIYSSLDYTIKKQLDCLNKAIDNKVSHDIEEAINRSRLLRAIKFFKKTNVFEHLPSKTTEDVVNDMVNYKIPESEKLTIDNELANEIIKKPISYLTRSHDSEIGKAESEIEELKNHNRKDYLISLYGQLKEMLIPIYNRKKHSIMESDIISNPRAKLVYDDKGIQKIQISDKGRGVHYESSLFLIGKDGSLMHRTVSAMMRTDIDTGTDEEIVELISDNCKYVEIVVEDNLGIAVDLDQFKYDKKVVNLSEGQHVCKAIGYSDKDVPDYVKSIVRTKISKPVRYERS